MCVKTQKRHIALYEQRPPYIVGSGLTDVYFEISCVALTRVRLNMSVYTHIIHTRIKTYQICMDIQTFNEQVRCWFTT